MSESQEEQFNSRLGFAGLAILGLVTSLSLVGLLLRMRISWRLASQSRAAQRRLSVSTASSSGGFESFSPHPPPPLPPPLTEPPLPPPPPATLMSSDLHFCPPTPISPGSTVSYYLDHSSVGDGADPYYWVIEEKLEDESQLENVFNFYDENLMRVPVYPGHCQCLESRNNDEDVRIYFC